MKLVIFIGVFLTATFHQVGIGKSGTLGVKILKSNNKNIINLSASNTDCIDSLIIHTNTWRIALGRPEFTDECVFEINSAETTVLQHDNIQSFELRVNGQSQFYESTDSDYFRRVLAK